MTPTTTVKFPRPEILPPASDRYVVVEASAGTGKTYFLEHRVVDLMLAGARLEQILVVTFTDKAVAELRMRVRDLLDRMARATTSSDAASAWELTDEMRARLRAESIAFDHAPIFTIHGFCNRVLVEDAFAARRPLEQEQVADEIAFDDAFKAVLAERYAVVEPDRSLLTAYLERERTVDQLRDLLLACARAGSRRYRSLDLAAITDLGERLRARFSPDQDAEALAGALGMRGRNVAYVAGRIGDLAAALAGSERHPAHVLAGFDSVRKEAKEAAERAPGLADLLGEALAAPTLDEVIAADLLPPLLARAGTDKAERGQFDYDDMLRLVRAALHDGARGQELAHRLRERTPWVLIDEFQDTDPVQWDIFRTVWLHDSSRGLAIVGDPKQAIYGFRGADVATYIAARDELLSVGATQVVLDTNQRSAAPLVRAVDEILLAGAPLLPYFDRDIRYEQPMRAAGNVEVAGARPPVTLFTLHGNRREDERQALAEAIGGEIERLRKEPPSWHKRGVAQPFSLADVMVLTRANKESKTIAASLRARGLPCALVEADKLFDTREADELAAVLAAIAAPRDRSARLRALRSRFFDVPWTELARVVDAPDHHPAITRLHDWAALATRRAYEQLFRRLFEDSRFAERAIVLGGGERAIVNTWHLIELLLEEVGRARCDLHELVGVLRHWIDDDVDRPSERDVQRLETDADAIRILTIHKSKGLEAPYVFLFGAASPPPAGQRLLRPDDAAIAAENQRLAYVALTRAQVRLYLPRYSEKALDKNASYAPVQRCLPAALGRSPELFETVDIEVDTPAPPTAPAGALSDFDMPAPPRVNELAALPAARAGLAMLSYTRLARELEAAQIEPAELQHALDRAELDADAATGEVRDDELPPGIDSGLYLHDLFEHVDLASLREARDGATWAAQPAVRALFADHARARGIAETYLPHAARIVHATLTSPLDSLPALISAQALAREVEFAYPLPSGHGLVRGFMDVLVAWDDELWVLDYKSDVLADPARATAHVQEHYVLQARLYALAAARLAGTRKLAGILFAFVRHGVTVAIRAPEDKLAAWQHWLAALPVQEAS